MEKTKDVFISNLRHLREAAGHTQADFAHLVGYSVRGYQKYEQGQSDPTPDVIDKFAAALECTPEMLVFGITERTPLKSERQLALIAFIMAFDEDQLGSLLNIARGYAKVPAATSASTSKPSKILKKS